mmetsp:Transcript_4899/g.9167  ORF Transcript_4899/g.9167 Transcript_4899/m.9167 type:complete len:153 (+) Transcript_4899:1920-2378(+)
MEHIVTQLKRLPLKLLPEWHTKLTASPNQFYPDFLKFPLKASSLPALLPTHTSKEIKVQELKENLLLEVDQVKNIAVSQHRGGNDRALAFNFTDGYSIIRAFEFEEIPDLNLETKPGTKVLLIAPIMIRRGVMVLSAANVLKLSDVESSPSS